MDGVATAHQALKLVQEGGDVLDMEVIFDVTGNLPDAHLPYFYIMYVWVGYTTGQRYFICMYT